MSEKVPEEKWTEWGSGHRQKGVAEYGKGMIPLRRKWGVDRGIGPVLYADCQIFLWA